MTAKGAIRSGFLGIVFVFASASLSVSQAPTMTTKQVTIDNNDCKTSQPTLAISIQDQVTWTAKDQAYILRFATSPFKGIPSGTNFPVPKGQTKSSGAVTDQVKMKCNVPSPIPACQFKYSVTGSGPHACNEDPVVIVTH